MPIILCLFKTARCYALRLVPRVRSRSLSRTTSWPAGPARRRLPGGAERCGPAKARARPKLDSGCARGPGEPRGSSLGDASGWLRTRQWAERWDKGWWGADWGGIGSVTAGKEETRSIQKKTQTQGAAPKAARSSWPMAAWPFAVAVERAVAPLWAATPGSAPRASSSRTISKWPCWLAMSRGVPPSFLEAFTAAPRASSS